MTRLTLPLIAGMIACTAPALAQSRSSAIVVPEPPPAPPEPTFDRARAIRNYEAIVRGTLRLHDLTPHEQAEVAEVARLARAGQGDRPSAAERCRRDHESDRPSPLEQALTDLRCGR